eukprot:GEMP01023468.1.p1 GENE.GEMP01023468.1~~GEMP01023468.1.p1  ORF type:complete len:469 (+),score=71.20 GEMP01023468.1:22-1428(+)
MVGISELKPSATISGEEYYWQATVFTEQEVDKLKKSEDFQRFTSNPSVKLKSAVGAWISLRILYVVIPILVAWYYISPTYTLQHERQPFPEAFGKRPVIAAPLPISKPRLWARPVTRRGLAYERIAVIVPPVPLAVQIVPVHLVCGFDSWVYGTGNQTTLLVPLPKPGAARLCVKGDTDGIVDLDDSIVSVCGVTYAYAPETVAGRSFVLAVEGVCLEGTPTLSVIPMGQSTCATGEIVYGDETAGGWSFLLEISVGSVPLTCVRTEQGWVQLPRLVILGATAYTASSPKLGSTMEISVSGIDMQSSPQLVLIDKESSCRDVMGVSIGLKPLSSTPALAKWVVDLSTYVDPLQPNRVLAGDMQMIVCVGWRGQYSRVGEHLTLENNASSLLLYIALAVAAVFTMVMCSEHAHRSSLDSPNTCAICWGNDTNVAFNCGHVCTCANCSGRCTICPICRTVIKKRLKVYFS